MVRYLFILLTILLVNNKCGNEKPAVLSPDATVYITATGTKYHLENCRSLKKSKTAISLPDAISKGYVACKICHPQATEKTTGT